MAENAVSRATHGVADATREVAAAVRGLTPAPDERGYVSDLASPWLGKSGLSLAVRLCVDRSADPPVSLASLFRRIPADYLAVVCIRETRQQAWVVRCVCGSVAPIGPDLTPCPGGCGRWLIADDGEAWAARLPAQDTSE